MNPAGYEIRGEAAGALWAREHGPTRPLRVFAPSRFTFSPTTLRIEDPEGQAIRHRRRPLVRRRRDVRAAVARGVQKAFHHVEDGEALVAAGPVPAAGTDRGRHI